MTDDLVKRLRDWSEYDEGKINDARAEAADRIEALEAQLTQFQTAQTYRYIGKDGKPILARDLEDAKDAAEAKLAKAVAALREAAHQHRVIAGFDLMCASVTACNAARAAEAVLRELGAEPYPPEFRADDAIFLAKYAQHVAEELGIAQSTEEPTP